jgi:hypothetical protein
MDTTGYCMVSIGYYWLMLVTVVSTGYYMATIIYCRITISSFMANVGYCVYFLVIVSLL